MRILMTLLVCLTFFTAQAQQGTTPSAKGGTPASKILKKFTSLKMPGETGTNGTRGASVVWNPLTMKYYASMAGNITYTMGVFDAKGKLLSDPGLTTNFDTRGLWFDALNKCICANGYDANGWIKYILDTKGIPLDTREIIAGKTQPDANAVGVSDGKKAVYFMNPVIDDYRFVISEYTLKGTFVKDHYLNLPETLLEYEESEFNMNCVLYTGMAGKEFAVLNPEDNQIHLFSKTTGKWVQNLILPEGITVSANFNAAYTNGMFWLFNQNDRTWYGLK